MGYILVAAYLIMIVIANYAVTFARMLGWSEAQMTLLFMTQGFLFIGGDLVIRDALHERWTRHKVWKLGALIVTGGLLSALLNAEAIRVAVASSVAFMAAATADAIVYQFAMRWPRIVRVNTSNVAGAIVDSVVFPTILFGGFAPIATLGMSLTKILGGAAWGAIFALTIWRERRPAPESLYR
jgi:uncharacterized PurR-regulated membrane protein YhhQ (DUF165 family)